MKRLIICLLVLASICGRAQFDSSMHAKQLVLNIPDLVRGSTIIKRKAVFIHMLYDTKDSLLALSWAVQHYAADSVGGYGEYLGATIPDKPHLSTADNTTIVSEIDGSFIYKDSTGNYPQNIPYCGQFNFFQYIADNKSILVNPMILQYGAASDWSE